MLYKKFMPGACQGALAGASLCSQLCSAEFVCMQADVWSIREASDTAGYRAAAYLRASCFFSYRTDRSEFAQRVRKLTMQQYCTDSKHSIYLTGAQHLCYARGSPNQMLGHHTRVHGSISCGLLLGHHSRIAGSIS